MHSDCSAELSIALGFAILKELAREDKFLGTDWMTLCFLDFLLDSENLEQVQHSRREQRTRQVRC